MKVYELHKTILKGRGVSDEELAKDDERLLEEIARYGQLKKMARVARSN